MSLVVVSLVVVFHVVVSHVVVSCCGFVCGGLRGFSGWLVVDFVEEDGGLTFV